MVINKCMDQSQPRLCCAVPSCVCVRCGLGSSVHVSPSSVSRPEQQVKVPPAGLIDFHQITGGLGGSVTTGAAEVDRGSEDPNGGAEKFELTPPEVWFQLKQVSSTNWLKP